MRRREGSSDHLRKKCEHPVHGQRFCEVFVEPIADGGESHAVFVFGGVQAAEVAGGGFAGTFLEVSFPGGDRLLQIAVAKNLMDQV